MAWRWCLRLLLGVVAFVSGDGLSCGFRFGVMYLLSLLFGGMVRLGCCFLNVVGVKL